MIVRPIRVVVGACLAWVSLIGSATAAGPYFQRIAAFPVYLNLPEGTDRSTVTSAEVVAATPDGGTLVYTDVPRRSIGFVDIHDPAQPKPAGTLEVDGTPTSVTVVGHYVLVGVDASAASTEPAGYVAVVDLDERKIQATCDVGGTPAALAANPEGDVLAVAVDAVHDETRTAGSPPFPPRGHLAIFDLSAKGQPSNCQRARIVDLAGVAEIDPADPDPVAVAVGSDDLAAVTLQTNNAVAIVDLNKGKVVGSFDAGAVVLRNVDADDDRIIAGTGQLDGLKREPNGIAWLGTEQIVTANEGATTGGSRGFTIFTPTGRILFEIGSRLEQLAMSAGHYPVTRATQRGVEPSAVMASTFGGRRLIVVGAKAGNFAAVYAPSPRGASLDYVQLLPTGVGPDGILAIPQLGLLVVATSIDRPAEGIRSQLDIYRYGYDKPGYPTLVSIPDPDVAAPIGWGALSGLTADPKNDERLYTVNGGFYDVSRVYGIDTSREPARIIGFNDVTRQGQPIGYDVQGVAAEPGGGFWLAAQGDPEAEQPLRRLNLLVQLDPSYAVIGEIPLPKTLADLAPRAGFQGVASSGEGAEKRLAVVFARPWKDDPEGFAKIGFYDPRQRTWTFALYPLEVAADGTTTMLADIASLGEGRFAVIEGDDRSGPEAAVKQVNVISLDGVEPKPYGQELPRLVKTRGIDLLPLLQAGHGWTPGKPSGLAVGGDGELYMVTDNEGLEKATGETRFLDLGEADDL
ncbi:MAG: esterase-like activity of phytase family protein [Geminicoccaceae bacterium]